MADETQTQTETQPDTQTSTETEGAAVGDVSTEVEQATETGEEESALGAAETDAEEAPAGPPEKYELAMEGVDLDPETVADAEPVLRELNLSNDAANKLLPVAAKLVERTSERIVQDLTDRGAAVRKAWLDEAKAAEDIGGAKWDETLHVAAKGLDALGFRKTGFGDDGKQPHPFRKALLETGFGNHPDMIRLTKAVGEMVGEDGKFVRSNATEREQVSPEDRWYGKKES